MHIGPTDGSGNAKKILTASQPEDWTSRWSSDYMKTVVNDLKSHNLTLIETVDVAHSWLIWRLLATSDDLHSS